MGTSIYTGAQPVIGRLPGFEVAGFNSPRRRDFLTSEAIRSQAVTADVMAYNGQQLNALDAAASSVEQRREVGVLRTQLNALNMMVNSPRQDLRDAGVAQLREFDNKIDDAFGRFEQAAIASAATASTADRKMFDDSLELNQEIVGELEPWRLALDSHRVIVESTDIDSPMALAQAAYKTVEMWQMGSGSRIAKDDVEAARSNITDIATWINQQIAAGAEGEGFLAETRNKLLATLQPIADLAEEHVNETFARYDAITEVGASRNVYDPAVVNAGIDRSKYGQAPWSPSALPTEAELAVADKEQSMAIRESAARTVDVVSEAAMGAMQALPGADLGIDALNAVTDAFEARRRVLAGGAELTPEAAAQLETLQKAEGGVLQQAVRKYITGEQPRVRTDDGIIYELVPSPRGGLMWQQVGQRGSAGGRINRP